MRTTALSGLLLGGLSLLLLGACNEDSAQVAQASSGGKTPREVCTEETVTRKKPVKDDDRVIGTVAGAVVGGVVGHEVGGKGTSKDVATAGGAIVGGIAGNRVQKSIQDKATETTTQRVCRTVYE